MNIKNSILPVIILILVASAGYTWVVNKNQSQEHSYGKEMQVDAELLDSEGKPIHLKDFKGKVVLINDWASWCRPCVAEMPTIVKLRESFSADDLAIIMVNFDQEQETGLQWMNNQNFDLPVYFPGRNFPRQFITNAIPATFILDKEGKILHQQLGMADYSHPDFITQMEKWINR